MVNAAAGGHVETMELLRKLGAKNYEEALAAAASKGHVNAINVISRWGVISDYESAFEAAAAGGHSEAMTVIRHLGPVNRNKAIVAAARGGHLKAMTFIRGLGCVDSNYYDEALSAAAANGQIDAMKLLKTWGASSGRSLALITAAMNDQIEAMIFLKQWEIETTEYDKALVVASHEGHLDAIKLLIKWGASDYFGALDGATTEGSKNSKKVVKLLKFFRDRESHSELFAIDDVPSVL